MPKQGTGNQIENRNPNKKMNTIIKSILIVLIPAMLLNCSGTKNLTFKSKIIYKTDDLIVTQISENSFTHVSYKQTNDFGNVPCNGLIVRDGNEVVIFDTPTNDKNAGELIRWIQETMHCKINAIIPTHFHDDCLGGLQTFHDSNIPSYANIKTMELAKENNLTVPKNGFTDSLVLKVGDEMVRVRFFGEGHTKDNVVGYFPSEDILFGGCLLKELNAGKGYLGDANLAEWSNTVEKIKKEYPGVRIVVPGHGDYGDSRLLDYTIKLFDTP